MIGEDDTNTNTMAKVMVIDSLGNTTLGNRSDVTMATVDGHSFVSCAKNSLYSEPERVLFACLGAILSLSIFFTNAVIFAIFVRDRSVAHVPGHIIITGMMLLSDILIGVVPLPGYLILTLCNGWPLPKFLCDLWITVDYISTNVSYLSVTAVAFERFIAVYFVLKHRAWMCRRNQIRLVAGLWLFTSVRIIICFPVWAIASGYREKEEYGKCDHPLYQNVPISLMHRSVSLYIPVVLVFCFYGAIIIKIFRNTNHENAADLAKVVIGQRETFLHCSSDSFHQLHSQPQSQSQRAAHRLVTGQRQSATLGSVSFRFLALPLQKVSAFSRSTENIEASGQELQDSGAKTTTVRRITPSNAPKTSSLARLRKSFRVVSLVIFAFLLSNLPWHVIENLRVTKQLDVRATDGVYVFTWILTYMNAFPLNAMFYFLMNKHYRRAIARCRTCTSNRTLARQQLQRQLVQLRAIEETFQISETKVEKSTSFRPSWKSDGRQVNYRNGDV